MAVLFRAASYSQNLEMELNRRGINYEIRITPFRYRNMGMLSGHSIPCAAFSISTTMLRRSVNTSLRSAKND